MNEQEIKNSLFICDNASCHKTKLIKVKCKKKKLKIFTNIPYKSEYNGIEFMFGYFKNIYYKFIFKNKTEQKNKIIEILDSKKIKENMGCFYLQAFENYIKFYKEVGNDFDIKNLYRCLDKKKGEI